MLSISGDWLLVFAGRRVAEGALRARGRAWRGCVRTGRGKAREGQGGRGWDGGQGEVGKGRVRFCSYFGRF